MFRWIVLTCSALISIVHHAGSQDIPSILRSNKAALGLEDPDSLEYSVSNAYHTESLGITHLYLEQRHRDIRVFNGILNLNMAGDKLVSFGNRWVSRIAQHTPGHVPAISPRSAVFRAAEHLEMVVTNAVETGREENSHGQVTKTRFDVKDLSEEEVTAELLWLPGESKEIRLCWMVEIHEPGEQNVWQIFIDAHSGEYVKKYNLVVHCGFTREMSCLHSPESHDITTLPYNAIQVDYQSGKCLHADVPTFVPALAPDSSYHVFAIPVESPNHGSRSIQIRPWTAAGDGNPAVTLGWHSTGTTTYTTTRGNNVHAYEDIDGSNGNNPGFSPDTADFRFDYPFDPILDPEENVSAAITNLFYWNNKIHDIMYQYGFDEPSGNFQVNNLGRGGASGDDVRAEGLDGGGSNNANFFTPADGSRPRMQMYLWSPVTEGSPLTINSPEAIAGDMFAIESAFSINNRLEDVGPVTGDLVLVEDSSGPTHLACGPLSNGDNLEGKIAVIDRGDCTFVIKVKTAQNNGAIAAIVINNVDGDPIQMGGTDNTITIPAVMISLSNGNLLKAVMDTETVNATLADVPAIIPDGDYDGGIITHEYGHGISIRLTGGPSQVLCLNNAEQMGEGWSDYFGLMLTTEWTTAQPTDQRGIGTYVLGQSTNGSGIRTYPYTTDMDINPFTYASIEDSDGSVHYIGSVWCTILWDMTWKIIEMAGVDPNIYQGSGGNNIALQLVIDALKLQPCSPGFVDGRDAILLADKLRYGGQYSCAIWEAFAARGLGVNASQGSSNLYTDCVESFDIPTKVSIESWPDTSEAGEGQEVTFHLRAICGCEAKSNIEIREKLSDDLIQVSATGATLDSLTLIFTADTLGVLDTLEFSYHAHIRPCSASGSTEIAADDAEAPDLFQTFKLGGSGSRVWVKNATLNVSPPNSWYAQDYSQYADYVLRLIDPLAITGPVEIRFYHRYETEATYDGGVVEYSTDGTTWLDAGPYFIENGYPSAITTTNTNSPIIGRDAFTGDSDTQFDTTGFIRSTIRLNIPPNETFRLRFRMACDGGIGGPGINGWYIDNIEIRQLSGITNETRLLADNVLQDSLRYMLWTTPFAGSHVYVDHGSTGHGSGTTWEDAMRYLPYALEIAGCREVDSVFVAEGTYLPNFNNDREIPFQFEDSTLIFGGFPAGGSPFFLRDPETHQTILSGDIGDPGEHSDNTYHVVKIDPTKTGILIDGVTISHGNANGTGDHAHGAAILCDGGLTLQNVIFSDHSGLFDGQMIYVRGTGASLLLQDCTIHMGSGGPVKIYNAEGAHVAILGNTEFIE